MGHRAGRQKKEEGGGGQRKRSSFLSKTNKKGNGGKNRNDVNAGNLIRGIRFSQRSRGLCLQKGKRE